MTTTVLLNFAAALLSFAFRYIPSADGWWANQTKIVKRLIMALLVVASGGLIYGMSCLGWTQAFNWSLACNEDGLQQIINLVFAALVNQGTYKLIEKK